MDPQSTGRPSVGNVLIICANVRDSLRNFLLHCSVAEQQRRDVSIMVGGFTIWYRYLTQTIEILYRGLRMAPPALDPDLYVTAVPADRCIVAHTTLEDFVTASERFLAMVIPSRHSAILEIVMAQPMARAIPLGRSSYGFTMEPFVLRIETWCDDARNEHSEVSAFPRQLELFVTHS